MLNRKLESILLTAKQNDASDVHLVSGRKPFMRVVGDLIPLDSHGILTPESMFSFAKDLLDQKQLSKISDLQETDFSFSFQDGRMRGTAFMQNSTIAVILRLIPKIKTLSELNLPQALEQFTLREQGLFLVVGPVGQGKTTTMASMVNLINTSQSKHIVTIENPIEYLFDEQQSIIDQRQVGSDTVSFGSGLKSVFRQDVDVIMVGEMRDFETMSTVVTAAETGHLVFSTLHTNNASQTIDRIIDAFPAIQQNQVRTQVSTSLLGVFSQRLMPSKKGGMVPAYELMINNKATANLIREGRTYEIDSVIQTSATSGMVDMNKSLIDLVRNGHIDREDAVRHSLEPNLLESMI